MYVGTVSAGQIIPSVLPLASITEPSSQDVRRLGRRLEQLGLVDQAKNLPADVDAFNDAIAATIKSLNSAAGNKCQAGAWRLGAVDGPVTAPGGGLGFICSRTTDAMTMLECDNPGSVAAVDTASSSPHRRAALISGAWLAQAENNSRN